MKKIIASIGILVLFGTGSAVAARTSDRLPTVNSKEIIAMVNEDPIYLEEFTKSLSSMHGHGAGDAVNQTGKVDYDAPLKRLIDTRLVLLEAENIGLGELAEIQEPVAAYGKQLLRELLLEKATRDVVADAALMNILYKNEVKQYVLHSLKISSEEEAKKIVADIEAGNDYALVASKAIAAGIAEGTMEIQKHMGKEMLPQVAAALAEMEKDSLSPIIPIQDGFVLIQLKDILYPEDPAARAAVENKVLEGVRSRARAEYIISLQEKYTQIDTELLDSLDFEAKDPGFETMLQDKRVVVTIEGAEPITVGELGAAIQKKFFHGIEQMMGSGKLNRVRTAMLHKILNGRTVDHESVIQGIDKSEPYKKSVEEYRRSLLFGAMMSKVIIPNIQMGEKDIEQYYQEHLQDFSSPAMLRLRSLVFTDKENAENACIKLRNGTELNWLAAHAEGQADAKSKGILRFGDGLLMLSTMPVNLQQQLVNARKGDIQSYADDNGYFYSLVVEDVVAPVPQKLAEVHEDIKEKVFKIKLQQAFDDMTAKLRDYYPVESYVDQLMDMSAVQ